LEKSHMIKFALAVTAIALACSIPPALAQENIVLKFTDAARADYPGEITLGTAPGQPKEDWFRESGHLQVRNVASAILIPFLPPKGTETGAAVIVAPGGAFLGLAIEEEGYRVARWMADHGVAAFVLKYRVLKTPADPATFRREVFDMRTGKGKASFAPPADTPPQSLEDGQAAIKLVRARAAQWGVDPNRVGMMGFSAGAYLTLSVALSGDAASRPAFIGPIYGRMQAREVPKDAPPMFVGLAADDGLFARQGFGLVESWFKAGRPVEFHFYQSGGHGFGTGAPGTTTMDWLEDFRRWLGVNGMFNQLK
jgi:acetyl esterase/lipase